MADVTVKICDRCKKTIEKRRGRALYRPIFQRGFLDLDLFKPGTWGDVKFIEHNMDLCEDCSNKLVWFLEGTELDIPEPSEATDA